MHALEGRAEWHHTDTERPTAEVCSLRSVNEVRTSCSPKAPDVQRPARRQRPHRRTLPSISPHLVGGGSSRIVNGSEATIPADLRLDRLLEHDNALFARYVRA